MKRTIFGLLFSILFLSSNALAQDSSSGSSLDSNFIQEMAQDHTACAGRDMQACQNIADRAGFASAEVAYDMIAPAEYENNNSRSSRTKRRLIRLGILIVLGAIGLVLGAIGLAVFGGGRKDEPKNDDQK